MLTPRQDTILRLIVGDYIRTASPIASDAIARSHDLGVSPATIRHDVACLEEAGYLTRPHSSAGSVPVDKAYRRYVESAMAMETDILPASSRWTIRRELSEAEGDIDEWATVAATLLARLVGNLAIATFPKAKESRIRHLELVHLQDFLVMLIVVLEQARLRRQIIRLKQPIEASVVETSTNRVRSEVIGLSRREIESKNMSLSPLEEEAVETAVLMMREEDRAAYCDRYVDGLRNLLGQPEFDQNDKVRTIVEGVEDGSLVEAVLEDIPSGSMVRVTIGQENRGDMLWPLSVVICQYGVPDAAVGAIGAVGPTRMEYPKTIAGVRFISSLMSELVQSVYSG